MTCQRCDTALVAQSPRTTGGQRIRPGFTLLELMVVLTIFSTLITIMLPPLMGASRRMRLESAAQSLVGDLRLARVEAIKRNRSIYVAKTGGTTYNIEILGARTLPEGVQFASTSPDTVRFAAFGVNLSGAGAFTLQLLNDTRIVRVTAGGNAK